MGAQGACRHALTGLDSVEIRLAGTAGPSGHLGQLDEPAEGVGGLAELGGGAGEPGGGGGLLCRGGDGGAVMPERQELLQAGGCLQGGVQEPVGLRRAGLVRPGRERGLIPEVSPLCGGGFGGRGAGRELVGSALGCGDAGYPGAPERDDHVFDEDVALVAVPRRLFAAGVEVGAGLAGMVVPQNQDRQVRGQTK